MTTSATRRTILAGAAALPALAMPALAGTKTGSSLAPVSDPIFAAIEAHRAAYAEFNRHVGIEPELEKIIPAERRLNYHADDRDNPEIGKNDDPRWTMARRAYFASSDKEGDAAVGLLKVAPTTTAGVAALLRYTAEFEKGGDLWPDSVGDDDDPDCGPGWHQELCFHAADALEKINAASATA